MATNKSTSLIEADIIGDKALDKALDQISKPASRRRVMRPAISEAAGAISKAAKANAAEETGELKRSIGHKTITKGGNIIAVIGPRRGRKKAVVRMSRYKPVYMNDPVRYAHLVEYGTPTAPPQPFLRPAMDQTNVTGIIRKRAARELGRLTQKAAAKGQRFA